MDEKKVIIGYTMGNTKVDERRYIGRFTIFVIIEASINEVVLWLLYLIPISRYH